MPTVIKFKRGLESNLPVLSDGEPGFTTDTEKLFIGNGGTNAEIGGGSGGITSLNGDTTAAQVIASGDGSIVIDVSTPGTVDLSVDVSGFQPLDSDLTAIAALTTDAFGIGLLEKTTAAAVRTYIGAGSGGGDVVGPISATDNEVPRYNGTTGKLIQGSGCIIDDSGNLTLGGDIAADNFSGSHAGTSSGTNTGDQTDIFGNAGTVTVDFNATGLNYLLMAPGSGNYAPRMDNDSNATYNATTNTLTAGTFVGALTGNASTATALATPRAINGTNFDGTAAITVTAAAGTLTGATLNATVTASSLTSVGTIATGIWQGTAVADTYIASAATWNAKQAGDATLTAFAALTIAANSLTIGTGADAFSQTTFAANTFPARASTGNLVAKPITDTALAVLAAEVSGTSFPGSPATGDRFFRTDRGLEYYYDGTRWLTTELFTDSMNIHGIAPLSATATVGVAPALGGTEDLWVVGYEVSFFIDGGTALSGSHKWVATLTKTDTSNATATIGTVSIDSGASSVWRYLSTTIGALKGTTNVVFQSVLTKTGTPGNIYYGTRMTYRKVG